MAMTSLTVRTYVRPTFHVCQCDQYHANFRAERLARKKNGRFQSTAAKSKTRNFLVSRKTKSRVIALMMLKCHFSPRVKVKPRYRGDVLSRGRAWFAFCFLLNEVGDLSFFRHNFIILLLLFVLSKEF